MDWSRGALGGLFAPHGLVVTSHLERISFTAASPRDDLDAEFRNHPLSVAARESLEPRGEVGAVTERARAILEAANEDPNSFRSTSSHVVATARRPLNRRH